jgi:hypothetical protein
MVEWILALFVVGAILMIAEVVLPTHGVLGAGGVLAWLAGLVLCFVVSVWLGLGVFVGGAVATPLLGTWWVRIWPRTPMGRRIVLPPAEVKPEPLPVGDGIAHAGRRRCASRDQRDDRRQQGEHRSALEDGHRDRPGRPRHPRRHPDQREPQGHRRAPVAAMGRKHHRRRRQGRHSAQGEGPRDGAHEHRAAGRRRHRGDDHRPRRRGHRHRDRLGR